MIAKFARRASNLIKSLHLQTIICKQHQNFQQVEKYCMFIGYPRSGHTLTGCLLNAHPNIVIANELDALSLINKTSRNQLFANILLQDQIFQKNNRMSNGYSYHVPNEHQGKFSQLKVIGDKKGGRSSRRLSQNENLLHQLQTTIKLPVFIIHVMRNPYDMIARRSVARSLTLQKCIDDFKMFAATSDKLRQRSELHWFDLYHEDFVYEPRNHLYKLCEFLGVMADEKYINNCTSIVFSSPKKSRDKVEWSRKNIETVYQEINKYHVFQRYSFEK